MRVEKDLNVTPEEFYESLINSVVEQVENTFGKEIPRESIKPGYSHKTTYRNQKTGAKRTTKYTITKAVPGKLFQTVFSNPDYKTKATYTMTPTEKGMHIVYDQDTTYSNPKAGPHGFAGSVDQFFLKRKLGKSLKQVEKLIVKNR